MNAARGWFGPCLAICLCCGGAWSQTVANISLTGDAANRIDMVILGDGYTASEMPKFASDANTVLTAYFAQQPHAEYRSYYNIRRIDLASTDSGVSHPELGVTKNTAYGSYYDCAGIVRLICANENAVYAAVGVLPADQQDLIMLIVNDTTYGGSGGSFLVTSMNSSAPEIALHELGHTLAHLADEYEAPPPPCADAVEPSQPNATKQTDRTLVKWAVWIDAATPVPTTNASVGVPGIYQGAMYCQTTLYRPTYNSKMRSLGQAYEQINSEQIVRSFYSFVSPIDSVAPATSSPITVVRGQSIALTVSTPPPATHALTEQWYIDDQVQPGIFGASVNLDTGSLLPGAHTVAVLVNDPTALVRSDPNLLLQDSTTWNVNVVTGLFRPTRPARFSTTGATASPAPAQTVVSSSSVRLSPIFVVPDPTPPRDNCTSENGDAHGDLGWPGAHVRNPVEDCAYRVKPQLDGSRVSY